MRLKLSFRALVLGGCLLVVLATLLAVALTAQHWLRDQITESARASLHQLTIMAGAVVKDRLGDRPAASDPQELASELSRLCGLRATLIAPDGRVLGDSSLSTQEVAALENHGRRPEVLEALASGSGDQIRYSSTIQDDLVYSALPITQEGRPLVLVRLAMPLTAVGRAVAAARGLLLLALAWGALLSLGVAYLVARAIDKPVRALAAAARAIAQGDLGRRIRRYPPHEIGDLARAFDRMADSLAGQMEQMDQARRRQEAILGGMVEGVLLTDAQGRVLLANRSLVSLLGLKSDPLGKTYSDVLRIPDLVDAMEEVLGGRPRHSISLRSLGPPPRHLEVHLARLEGGGAQGGAVAVMHDVTERRRTEQMRRDFVANTSHELRTPLAAIKGAAETLKDGALSSPEHAEAFVEMILRQCDRLERLSRDILSLASLENAAPAAAREPVAIMDLVEAALAAAAPLAQGRGIQVAALPPAEPLTLPADPRQLEQALLNLLDNAIRYNQPGGRVEVSVTRDQDQAVITVTDSGPGIPAEHLPRVFERFYRVDKNRSREQGGTGLGLAIVKHVAGVHGGRVEVASRLGQGSRFSLILPLMPEEGA